MGNSQAVMTGTVRGAAPAGDGRPSPGGGVLLDQNGAMPGPMVALLRESTEWFFATLRSIGDAVIASDAGGRVTFLNARAEALTGWPLAEALGKRLQDVLRIERAGAGPVPPGGGCAGLLGGTRPAGDTLEALVIARDGTLTPVEAGTALIREGGGPIRGVVRILRDAGDRKRAEESLRKSELRYRNLVDRSQDVLFTLSRQGLIASLNPAFARITGWSAEEWLYRPFADLLHPGDRERATAGFQRVLAGQSLPRFEMRVKARDGRDLVLECACTPNVEEDRPAGAWGIARDVTQRKRLEQRALQSQKLEAVSRLAGGIAHDFNNLLTAINGYTDFLRQSLGQDSPLVANVDGILSSVSRAATLTRQLLAFSRQRKGQPRRMEVNALIGGMLPSLTHLLEENISLDLDLGKGQGAVFADPSELEQALTILVTNAREAMPRGGRLTLRTAAEDGRLAITVADTGCGMTDAVKERLFEPFFTTKPIGTGMGLGLSTVYGIVKLAGGDIQAESAVDRGTTFRILLPVLPEGAGSEPAAAPASEPSPGGETILLVEDDEEVRFLLYSILRSDGYAVLEARNGEEALGLAESHAGPIHLILTDLHMPRMGGRRLAENLLPRHPGMKAMFMSGFAQEDFPAPDGSEPPAAFLQKPFMPKSMLRQVRKLLDG